MLKIVFAQPDVLLVQGSEEAAGLVQYDLKYWVSLVACVSRKITNGDAGAGLLPDGLKKWVIKCLP